MHTYIYIYIEIYVATSARTFCLRPSATLLIKCRRHQQNDSQPLARLSRCAHSSQPQPLARQQLQPPLLARDIWPQQLISTMARQKSMSLGWWRGALLGWQPLARTRLTRSRLCQSVCPMATSAVGRCQGARQSRASLRSLKRNCLHTTTRNFLFAMRSFVAPSQMKWKGRCRL